mmetsp:Transcript_38537/g.110662  ORF Transcript_38537/g.110662 Transcript_38537/m.110662 type:complete len:903 (-) Transcript_38537:113-2821(-)
MAAPAALGVVALALCLAAAAVGAQGILQEVLAPALVLEGGVAAASGACGSAVEDAQLLSLVQRAHSRGHARRGGGRSSGTVAAAVVEDPAAQLLARPSDSTSRRHGRNSRRAAVDAGAALLAHVRQQASQRNRTASRTAASALAFDARAADTDLPSDTLAAAVAVAAADAFLHGPGHTMDVATAAAEKVEETLQAAGDDIINRNKKAATDAAETAVRTLEAAGDLASSAAAAAAATLDVASTAVVSAARIAAGLLADTLDATGDFISQGIFGMTRDVVMKDDSGLSRASNGWNSVIIGVADLGYIFGEVLLESIVGILRSGTNPIEEVVGFVRQAMEFAINPMSVEKNAFADAIAKAAAGMNIPGTLAKDQALNSTWPSTSSINRQFAFIVGGVVGLTLLGLVADLALKMHRVTFWKLALWISSYALLAPGLFCTFLRYNLAYTSMGIRWAMFAEPPEFDATLTLSVMSLIHRLWRAGCVMTCALVLFFALVLPLLKLVLVIQIEILAMSPSPQNAKRASAHLTTVHLMSKWVCTDVLGYVMVMSLYRDLQGHEGIDADSQLDLGFICFAMSCLCTACLAGSHAWQPQLVQRQFGAFGEALAAPIAPAAAALEQPLPLTLPSRSTGEGEGGGGLVVGSPSRQGGRVEAFGAEWVRPIVKRLGRNGVYRATLACCVVFAFMLAVGCASPCLQLSTDLTPEKAVEVSTARSKALGMKSPEEMLPPLLAPLRNLFGDAEEQLMGSLISEVEEQMYAVISITRCLSIAWQWVVIGDAASLLILAFFAGFVVAVPVLNMVALGTAAWLGSTGRPAHGALALAKTLKNAAMLDVCIISVALMRLAGAFTKEQGGGMYLQGGFFLLVLAEIIHSATFCLVTLDIGQSLEAVSAAKASGATSSGGEAKEG